jgi:hypothetical protein
MTVIGGRGGRHDDWSSDHDRARARAAERLDGPLDADEGVWLDEHLASCNDCSAVAAEYAAERLDLRALRDHMPAPPRDLWARTSAALERESRHRSSRRRSSSLRPYALLAGALVVAIAVGTLSSSQWFDGDSTATPGPTTNIAVATTSPTAVAPTPLAVGPRDVAYIKAGGDGSYTITQGRIDEVCPSAAADCESTGIVESRKDIGPLSSPESVFGTDRGPLIVLSEGEQGSRLLVVAVPTEAPAPTEQPSETPSAPPSTEPGTSDTPPSGEPSTSASPTATANPDATPSDQPSPTPSETSEAIEIATNLQVIDSTAAYAPDGSAFAFTAQPADGSNGPDIYVWRVGETTAQAVTQDHRSVFGSWSGDDVVGSSVEASADGSAATPRAILVSRGEDAVALTDAGLAWRPAVDPTGERAVYWAGTVAQNADGGFDTADGRLVIGRWGDIAVPDPSGSPDASASPGAADASASPGAADASASPNAPNASAQAEARGETTIAEGPLTDWDVRWDETGTRLAVWVADADDPSTGKLSLYVVDPFDGSIGLENAPLKDERALAGFSLDDGRLAWAAPPESSDAESRVLVLAWTGDEFGQVESAPGDVLLVR